MSCLGYERRKGHTSLLRLSVSSYLSFAPDSAAGSLSEEPWHRVRSSKPQSPAPTGRRVQARRERGPHSTARCPRTQGCVEPLPSWQPPGRRVTAAQPADAGLAGPRPRGVCSIY